MNAISDLISSLGYDSIDTFDIHIKSELVRLVSWLEDRKIRELEISERESLRVCNDLWDSAFCDYLIRLDCKLTWNPESPEETLMWLVSHAVALEYDEIAPLCHDMEAEHIDDHDESIATSSEIDSLGELVGVTRKHDENDAGEKYCI